MQVLEASPVWAALAVHRWSQPQNQVAVLGCRYRGNAGLDIDHEHSSHGLNLGPKPRNTLPGQSVCQYRSLVDVCHSSLVKASQRPGWLTEKLVRRRVVETPGAVTCFNRRSDCKSEFGLVLKVQQTWQLEIANYLRLPDLRCDDDHGAGQPGIEGLAKAAIGVARRKVGHVVPDRHASCPKRPREGFSQRSGVAMAVRDEDRTARFDCSGAAGCRFVFCHCVPSGQFLRWRECQRCNYNNEVCPSIPSVRSGTTTASVGEACPRRGRA